MTMFRKRLMRDPSPYYNPRITFLSQDFVMSMVNEYKKWETSRKSYVFRSFYIDHVKGIAPKGSPTNKEWYTQVDHLYACHNITSDHWVALDIDLASHKIFVYDSIPSLKDVEMIEQCRPFARMIPALLNLVIPNETRKKSTRQLEVRRVKTGVPVNENPGDCGVYTLKYIECLALGSTFDGLCDSNIQGIRMKLAAELFDEVREETQETHELREPLPPRVDITIPHLKDT